MTSVHNGNRGLLPAGRKTLFAAVVAAAMLASYVWFVGSGTLLGVLTRLSPVWVTTLVFAGFVPVLLWGISLKVVFAVVHRPLSVWKAVGLFVASVFMNSVTMFGQVGGDPPSALLIAKEEGTSFESGLAAVSSVNALNRLAVISLGLASLGWYSVRIVSFDRVQNAVLFILVSGVVGIVSLAIVWLRRDEVCDLVATSVTMVGEHLPVIESPSNESVLRRTRQFVAAVEQLLSNPPVLVAAFLLGIAGHVSVAGVLWLVLVALDVSVSIPFVFFVIPVAKLAGITPVPGGSGPAEALLSGLLVTAGGVSTPVAVAAALLYRAVVFFLPTVVGGIVTVWLLLQPTQE